MEKNKLKLGQKVWIELDGNEGEIRKAYISKIGKTYMYCRTSKPSYCKFRIDTLIEHSRFRVKKIVYLSEKDLYDKREYYKLRKDICRYFIGYNTIDISLDALREIMSIIDEAKLKHDKSHC